MESLESLQNQYRKEAASLITDVGKIAQESGLADSAAVANLEDVLTGITLLVINAGMSLEQVEDVVAELEKDEAPTQQEVDDEDIDEDGDEEARKIRLIDEMKKILRKNDDGFKERLAAFAKIINKK